MGRNVRGVRLKHLNRSGRWPSGNPRYYYRPKGGKGIPMPDAPMDSPVFLEAYARAARARTMDVMAHAPNSLGAATRAYLGSDAFHRLAPSTRAYMRRQADHVAQEYGVVPFRQLTSRNIRADLARRDPNPANMRLRFWRALCSWGFEQGILDADPSQGIKKRRTESKGHTAWTRQDVADFRLRWPLGSRERLAMELMHWTGCRISDAVRVGPQHVRDGWLEFEQQKTGGLVCIPLIDPPAYSEPEGLAHLIEAIDAMKDRHLTYLVTAYGRARSAGAATQWFSRACAPELSAHGLRKLRGAILRENGATLDQRGAWLGHESDEEIASYGASADLRRVIQVPTFQVSSNSRGKRQ